MNPSNNREQALDTYGPLLVKMGYEWVDIDKVAETANLNPDELRNEFPSKVLLCDAWMESTDHRTRRHHDALLDSGRPAPELVEQYVRDLEAYMESNEFGGCPFSNTARATRGNPEPRLQRRIVEHKTELRRFFRRLCEKDCFQPELLSEALFLMYSGATTESSNLRSLEPVVAGRQAALALHKLHSAA